MNKNIESINVTSNDTALERFGMLSKEIYGYQRSLAPCVSSVTARDFSELIAPNESSINISESFSSTNIS